MVAQSKTSGVYAIRRDGRMYVGSSADVSKRWTNHRSLLRRCKHHNTHLQNAWNKYGEDAFEFFVLEECSVELLIEREQFHLDQCSDKYNCAPIAGTRRGVPQSPESIAKTVAAKRGSTVTPETKAMISASMIGNTNSVGRVMSDENRERLSAILMGNQRSVGHVTSPETRERMSAARKAWWARKRAEEAGSTTC